MKLSHISGLISESEFPLWEFVYPEYNTDPTPKTIVLGVYADPSTGNQLMAGVNVRLLNTLQSEKLLRLLNTINTGNNTQQKVRLLRSRANDIFDTAYRTYDIAKMKEIYRDVVSGTTDEIMPAIEPDAETNVTPDIKPITPVVKPDIKPVVKPITQPTDAPATKSVEPIKLPTKHGEMVQRPRRNAPNTADEVY